VQALCLLLVDAARQQPLMVHVSDCHWAQRSGLDLFRDVRDRLADLPDPRLRRVAFVFEGRSRESLALGPDGGDGTVAWETFVAQTARPVLEVPVLSREQSEAFLVSLFESTQSAERSVPEELVPLQDVLVEEIRRHGEGNPFHMVEQLRLLRHQGVVACNQRTGLLYLAGHPDERHAVPHDVRELIHLRVDYLRRRHPAAGVLLAACAFILDRVPRALYDHLRERLAPGVPEAEILGTGFLQPSDEMLGEVRFRHENYYEVMRGLEVSAADRERIGCVYFEWMDARGGGSAQALLERALVMARMPAPPAPAIRSLLTEALEKADAAHQYVLSRRVAEHLLPVVREAYRESGAAEDLLESIRVERRLTHLLGMTGSWLERERMLRALVRRMRDMLADPQVQGDAALRLEVDYHLHASLVSQANVWIDTLEHHEAIRLMEGALPDLEARLRAARDSGDPRTADWARLYVQGKNRLAVARWFDGRHAASRRLFRTGFRECRSLSDRLYEFHNLLDYATLCIHRDPRRASALLGECLAMLDRLEGGGILPRHRYLAQFQRAIAELLATARGRGDLAARARELAADAQAVHVNALREGYVHEQGGASLVAGVCCAIGEEPEAARWLMHSIRVSHTSHLLEFLWKAHLNLGQLCLELPPQAREGAGQHAEAAQRILTADLERRSREDDRRHRRALYLLPLAQLARVWDALDDARGGGVRAEFPEVRAFFGPGGALRPDRHHAGQVLHATRGESDYFLLS
jgi:hypothetical protein